MANPEHVALVLSGAMAPGERWLSDLKERLDLSGADLAGADLAGAYLDKADLSTAKLSGADLRGAWLGDVNLTFADLTGANLSKAFLFGVMFYGSGVFDADFSNAILSYSSFAHVDLSGARGLATLTHNAPSGVGVDTVVASIRGAGNKLTPELLVFFRAAGVPAELLEALPGIVAEVKYWTCFIAYGQPDVEFASRLKNDLVAHGVSCWLYGMDATVGEPTWAEIVRKRRGAEKVVVLCSLKALVRPGMLKEVEEQVDEDMAKLMPVSLDNDWREPGFKVMRDSRNLKPYLEDVNYADFANLEYEEALERLLAGLRRDTEQKDE